MARGGKGGNVIRCADNRIGQGVCLGGMAEAPGTLLVLGFGFSAGTGVEAADLVETEDAEDLCEQGDLRGTHCVNEVAEDVSMTTSGTGGGGG